MCDPCSRDIRSGEANRLLDRHPTTASTAALIPKKRHHLQEGRLELNAVLSVVIPATAGLDELSRSAALSSLFLLSKVAETPRSPEELLAITTLPIDPPQSDFPFRPEAIFRVRVLGYLEWFGLLEKLRIAANDQVGQQHLYRKTPLFDRFLSFDIEALIS